MVRPLWRGPGNTQQHPATCHVHSPTSRNRSQIPTGKNPNGRWHRITPCHTVCLSEGPRGVSARKLHLAAVGKGWNPGKRLGKLFVSNQCVLSARDVLGRSHMSLPLSSTIFPPFWKQIRICRLHHRNSKNTS